MRSRIFKMTVVKKRQQSMDTSLVLSDGLNVYSCNYFFQILIHLILTESVFC